MTADDNSLRRAQAAADEARRELESFTHSVAHDLRAPLRTIEGFSEALVEDCAAQLDTDGKRYLQYIRESAQRMTQLIDGLVELSRLSRGELVPTQVDLSVITRKTLDRLRAAEPSRVVEAVIPDGVLGHADTGLLTLALENLLGNAWKFTSEREAARIEFGVEPGKHPPVYFVRDNGAGFDSRYADKLFGVFQRLHAVDEFEGIGIGLAAVRRIIRRHGGRTWAEAAPDQGATFYFTLGDDEPPPRPGPMA
jgi:light-regulated signal transduction histidine kinase (bacteriophytochrome)